MRERDRLIARIRQMRRVADRAPQQPAVDPKPDQLRALEVRIDDLEALVQGLQDSIHRESSRQSKRIAELETQMQPGTLSKALSEDARARGL